MYKLIARMFCYITPNFKSVEKTSGVSVVLENGVR
jgi:hypothetical protein